MEYIREAKEGPRGACVFCALLEDGLDGQPPPILIEPLAWVTLAKYPYNPGHLLVLPVRHEGDLEALSADESAAISALIRRSVTVLREASDPHGFNIGLNVGRVAGAGIPDHLHWHVIPRWGGDSNFMPVIGQTRVLPELLSETYERLKPGFDV
jgi:ATP adenylyltransferase